MTKYKTMVSDYEGMQSILDNQAESGWKLFSVTADTWRKIVQTEDLDGAEANEGLAPPPRPAAEYSASYYLLVFIRESNSDVETWQAQAEEMLPSQGRHFFEG